MPASFSRMIGPLLAAVLCSAAPAAAAETLADARKAIAELNARIRSLTARFEGGYTISDTSGSNESRTEGTYEFAFRDGKLFSRTESRTVRTIKVHGRTNQIESSKLEICDGESARVLQVIPGAKSVTREPPTSRPADPVEPLAARFDLVLLPDESVDGQPCWVIEALPRKDVPVTRSGNRSRHYFRRSDGVLVRTIYYDGRGGETNRTTYRDIKVNVPIPPERFDFKPPPDATYYDVEEAKPPAP